MREVRLGDLIEPAKVKKAGDQTYPILSMTMRHGLVDQSTKFIKRVASKDTCSYKVVKRNDLVVGFPIDEGVLSFQTLYDQAIVSPAYDIWKLKTKDDVYIPYMEKVLKSPSSLHYYLNKLRGSTARRRTLPDDIFLDLKVPLPPLSEQKRIAAILDKADEIRRKREEAIRLCDEFLKSVFLEMFGDPGKNPKCWNSDSLGNIARFLGGGTPDTSEERFWNGNIPWVSPKDMKSTFISNSIDKITKEAVEESTTQLIPQGSVLVVNRSGILKKKLPLGINTVPVAINQDLKAMVPTNRLLSNFLLFQLIALSPTILRTVRATTADNISTDVFKKLSLLVPPIENQSLFSDVVERHRQLSEKLTLSLTSMDNLTGSLQTLY